MSEKNGGKGRTRNFATIVYPESAPDNWIDVLREEQVNVFISPLHDSDLNPTGEPKKAHYHVFVMYESVKTVEQFLELCEKIGGVGYKKVNSIRGMARYLCHLDNPEKARYLPDDVITIGYEDYYDVITLPSDKYGMIRDIMGFCDCNDVYSFSDLLSYCANNQEDWFRLLCDSGTYVIKEYLKSKSFTKKNL